MWWLFRKQRVVPKTVPQAVSLLKSRLSPDAAQALRLASPWVFESHPPPADVLFRDLGLNDDTSRPLLRACGTSSKEDAAVTIFCALRENLMRTVTLAELAADGEERRQREAATAAMAAKDPLLTDRRCPWCKRPCPSYRITCKYCSRRVRDGASQMADTQRDDAADRYGIERPQ